ncbi:NAD(P)-binding domain-containing protein, partial [Paenibacillus sepulcri]|nr:NAD(P)-binding domain-containing protein [Paenibacillus sepulcri]
MGDYRKMTVVLVGAGGKMGCRITDNLRSSEYEMRFVETGLIGLEQLAARSLRAVPQNDAVKGADMVILAVPDVAIKQVSQEIVPLMNSGAMLILLDPAAAYIGQLPERGDIGYFVAHPCHPPIFNDETEPEAKRDFFGGVAAKQAVVCTLVQGSEEDYGRAEELAKRMYAP